MRRITAFFLLLMMVIWTTGQELDKTALKMAVEWQFATYPESQLQDVYKNFFQEHFGPEHIITDTAGVRNYLDRELASMGDLSNHIYFESIGLEGNYVRVYLDAVSDGMITVDQLLHAFVESANEHKVPTTNWTAKWKAIVDVVDEVKPGLGTEEERKFLLKASQQNQAVHHSQAYNAAYHPHYRIIKREIFEQQLYPAIVSSK